MLQVGFLANIMSQTSLFSKENHPFGPEYPSMAIFMGLTLGAMVPKLGLKTKWIQILVAVGSVVQIGLNINS
jgi:hypothetical protein